MFYKCCCKNYYFKFLSCDKKTASNNSFLFDGIVSGRSLLNFVIVS